MDTLKSVERREDKAEEEEGPVVSYAINAPNATCMEIWKYITNSKHLTYRAYDRVG